MSQQPEVLIVDDEPDIRELLSMTLQGMNISTVEADSVRSAHNLLTENRYDLCLTDMRLPDGNGIELVRHIQKFCPETPVAVITAYGNMESAVGALKAGAFDFVAKPVKLEDLRNLVNSALKLQTPPNTSEPQQLLLGQSEVMQELRRLIVKVARSQAPVYISGASGTGKEIVARLIHKQGPRAEGPFVAVNCGAIPSELMESEFFGHKKGSFTGAIDDKLGLFQAAHGGTLFLDEVAELPLLMQVKLLRAIQEKAVRAIGAREEALVDTRILSATHKDLAPLVEAGDFRQDLFYRINVIEIKVPTLSEKRQDIPELAVHILDNLSKQSAILSEEALALLQNYSFPGNVRELENILERALTMCDNNEITAEDLCLPTPVKGAANEFQPKVDTLEDFLTKIEREAIEKALVESKGNKTAAAKRLGISFRAMRYKLEKLGFE